MAHVVFVTTGITSHLNAYSALARWLQQQGHDISFLAVRENGRTQVEERGFHFRCLEAEARHLEQHWKPIRPPGPRKVMAWLYRLPLAARLLPYLAWPAQRRRALRHRAFLLDRAEFDLAIAELQPDVLFLAPELTHHVICAAKSGINTVLLETHVSTLPASNVPILDATIIPEDSNKSRRRCRNSWRSSFRKRRLSAAFQRFYLLGADEASAIRQLAGRRGFEYEREVILYRHWHPYSFCELPVINLCAAEFDFPRDDSEERLFLGPQVDEGRSGVDLPPAVKSVLDLASETQRPLVLSAMGSFSSMQSVGLLRRIITTMEQNPQWILMMSINDLNQSDLLGAHGSLPDNVFLFSSIPLLRILPHAKAMVSHGGIATINECVNARVPMLIFSNGFLDRNGNATRVVFHGLGLRGDIDNDSPATLADHLERLIVKDEFPEALMKMKARYAAYGDDGQWRDTLDRAGLSSLVSPVDK